MSPAASKREIGAAHEQAAAAHLARHGLAVIARNPPDVRDWDGWNAKRAAVLLRTPERSRPINPTDAEPVSRRTSPSGEPFSATPLQTRHPHINSRTVSETTMIAAPSPSTVTSKSRPGCGSISLVEPKGVNALNA
jgi:hypothetical protein